MFALWSVKSSQPFLATQVGKCHAAAEWTFGTIYQRFLSGALEIDRTAKLCFFCPSRILRVKNRGPMVVIIWLND